MTSADLNVHRSQRMCNGFLRSGLCAALAFAAFLAGCKPSTNTVSVHGSVKYQGQPVTPGLVTFFPAVGRPTHAPISDDGSYTTDLEPGEYVVTVGVGVVVPPGFKEGDPTPEPKIKLPNEYTSRGLSSLKATVTDGEQPIDFELK